MKKCAKVIVAIVGGLILTTTLVACGFHQKTPEEKADYLVEKVTKKLDLNEGQAAKLDQLKLELLDIRNDFKATKEEHHKAIEEIFSQPTLDQQRLLEMVQEHTAAVNEKAPTVIASFANFYDSLNPEQQGTLKEKITEHKHKHHHWSH